MQTVLNLFGWQRFGSLLVLLFLCHDVAANTEIIRFSSSRRTADPRLDVLVGNWPTLHPSDNERRWSLGPAALHTPLHQVCERVENGSEPLLPSACPHELWVRLDLDDEPWASYATFTLRLSWPASAPADFAIALYDQEDLLARLPVEYHPVSPDTPRPEHAHDHARTTTRTRYARIRAVNAGVPTPGSSPRAGPGGTVAPPSDADSVRDRHRDSGSGAVPFVLVLEPAYLGVLPASLLPTVGFLVLVLLVAVTLVVPWVMAYVEPFARQAREDLNAEMKCSLGKER